MMKLTSKEKYKTSMGTAFIVDNDNELEIGKAVIIDGVQYTIKRITSPSRPSKLNKVAIFV